MQVLQTFKDWVDQHENPIASFKHDHLKVCEYLGIDTTYGYSKNKITDVMRDRIQETLTANKGDTLLAKNLFKDLKDALVFEAVLENKDNSKYLEFWDAMPLYKMQVKDFSYTADWQSAITYTHEYVSYCQPRSFPNERLREDFPKEYDVAKAHLYLRNKGASVELNDLTLKVNHLEPIISFIESEIRSLSGINIMNIVFSHLINTGHYYPSYNHWVIFNRVGNIPELTDSMLPYGYVLNLCVKYPGPPEEDLSNLDTDQFPKRVTAIFETCTALATMLNVRKYSNMEYLTVDSEDLPKFIRDLSLFDASYSFPAHDLSMIIELMENLFVWLDITRFETNFGFTPAELICLTRLIDRLTKYIGPHIYQTEFFTRNLVHIDPAKISRMLEHLSHEKGIANKDYNFFYHYDKMDFGFKPLIKLNQDQYLLCDKSWCAQAFYEVLATLARELDSYKEECNIKIGYALEDFIQKKLKEKNIQFETGNYADGTKPDGEADVVIQSSKAIILAELKKKFLTRKARTGYDVSLIIDLANSLLDAHLQTGRTEILLRKQRHLDLVNNSGTTTIEHKDREIERIALTQWDFGSFQDRLIIKNILNILITTDINLIDKTDKKLVRDFKKIEKKIGLWREQASTLVSLDDSFVDNPFFNCWFLSLPKLLTIIKFSKGNESFQEILFATRHLTYGTHNFYAEFYQSYIHKMSMTAPTP